jgi:hypothetical protein
MTGPRCIVCGHPRRAQIEAMHASGASLRAVARRFHVTKDCLWRHGKAHFTERELGRTEGAFAKIESVLLWVAQARPEARAAIVGVLRDACTGSVPRVADAA